MSVTTELRQVAIADAEDLDVIVVAEARDHATWHTLLTDCVEPGRTVRVLTPTQAAEAGGPSLDGVALIVDALDDGATMPLSGQWPAITLQLSDPRPDPGQAAGRIVRRPQGMHDVAHHSPA